MKINLFKLFSIFILGFALNTAQARNNVLFDQKPKPKAVAKFDEGFYLKSAKKAADQFRTDSVKNSAFDIDIIFLKIEKKLVYQMIKQDDLRYFEFQNLTNAVVQYIKKINSSGKLSTDSKKRAQLQLSFYGLSQAIKKANQINLTIQAEQFDKLHDILVGQSTSLFYSSYRSYKRLDLFWNAYFLNELNYPMDLTAKHLEGLDKVISQVKDKARYQTYGAKLAKMSLGFGQFLSKPTAKQIDVLYKMAMSSSLSAEEVQTIQKSYLKQIQIIGDSEKIKDFKKELAGNLLIQETKNTFHNPLNIFKFIQFIIGYIFIAWPLEIILFLVSITILVFQASTVLTNEEKRKAKNMPRKIWMMFTKAYLGSNVPFFSKLAASLILFGIGLYFNSAKNFVESLIGNI